MSSTTSGIGSYSLAMMCGEPSSLYVVTFTAETAYPWIEDSRMRRSVLPIVTP